MYGIMINNRRSPRNHHLPCFHNDVRIRRRSCMNREIVIDKKASRSRSTRCPRPATRARANSVVCLRRPCTRRRLTSSCITASRRVPRSFAAPISPSRRSRAASGSAARAIIPRCSGSLCSAPPPNTAEITPRSRRLDAAKPERQPSWLSFWFYIPAAAWVAFKVWRRPARLYRGRRVSPDRRNNSASSDRADWRGCAR